MKAFRGFLCLPLLAICSANAVAGAFYPQPAPSNQEQYILELINAARANPPAEGQMLASITEPEVIHYYNVYDVDLSQVTSDFATYAVKPPVCLSSDLNAAAREHSLDQAVHGFQGHNSSDGTTFTARISSFGYQWSAVGENVFGDVEDPFIGHVGLNVDWGVPTLEHRIIIMNLTESFPTFKQIGISYVPSSVPDFGPFVLTEDFGTPLDSTESFLTGVVYNDVNGNGAYDMGEGLGGVTITTDTGAYYTTTSASGGYVLPLPAGSGAMTITASGGGLGAPRMTAISYGHWKNVKVDFTPAQAIGTPLPVVRIETSTTNLIPGGRPCVITIARSGSTTQGLQVALATSGSAIPGLDCTAVPKTVTLPAGAVSTKIKVKANAAANTGAPIKQIKIQLHTGFGYLVGSEIPVAKAAVQLWLQN